MSTLIIIDIYNRTFFALKTVFGRTKTPQKQNNKNYSKYFLTLQKWCGILFRRFKNAGVAQLVEQLICNQQVGGSSPSTSSSFL